MWLCERGRQRESECTVCICVLSCDWLSIQKDEKLCVCVCDTMCVPRGFLVESTVKVNNRQFCVAPNVARYYRTSTTAL